MKIQRGGIFFIQQYFYNLKIPDEHLYFGFMGNGSVGGVQFLAFWEYFSLQYDEK